MSFFNSRIAQSRLSFPKFAATAVVSLSLFSVSPASWSQGTDTAVKMSGSGICHDTSSRHYERVKSFKPYPSMQACLDDGGREPRK
jgi:predicted heme/steroid binding protein